MNPLHYIYTRRSIRKYKKRKIGKSKIKKILEAARQAPSAHNLQPWFFYVIQNKKIIEKLSKTHKFAGHLSEAPLVIVACGNEKISRHFLEDTCAAIENILIACRMLELGACWTAIYDPKHPEREKYVKKILKLPKEMRPIAMISIGYPDQEVPKIRKKPLEEITKWM